MFNGDSVLFVEHLCYLMFNVDSVLFVEHYEMVISFKLFHIN